MNPFISDYPVSPFDLIFGNMGFWIMGIGFLAYFFIQILYPLFMVRAVFGGQSRNTIAEPKDKRRSFGLTFGILLTICGLFLTFTIGDYGNIELKFLGMEVEGATTRMIILLVGAALVALAMKSKD